MEQTALAPLDGVAWLIDASRNASDTAFRNQQVVLEAMLAWQRSLAALQAEWWDEWACRWAGGVPLDG